MATVGDQADNLRALGRLLGERGAREIDITFYEAFLTVSWMEVRGAARQQSFQEGELEAIRAQAQACRGSTSASEGRAVHLAEWLRVLGQELSARRVEATRIVEEPEGFRVAGQVEGRYVQDFYRRAALDHLSAQRRNQRGRLALKPRSLGERLAAVQQPAGQPKAQDSPLS